MLNRVLALTFVFALPLVAPTGASAAAQRTFLASTGNDTAPCSLTQPCRGFARAITQTNSGGEVIVLDSAGYGPVTITKSVSLIAPGGVYAGITVTGGDGITVNAPGAIVVLRGLSINGQGGSNGVNVLQAERVRIESCVVSGMGIDGIMYSAPGLELVVLDTIVRDNGASGIGGDADAFVVVDHVRSEHNGTNGFYMASLVAEARATITDSVFAFNSANGIWLAATGTGTSHAQVERSVLADNGGAGLKISAAQSGFMNATVMRNAVHLNGPYGVLVTAPGGLNSVRAMVSENAFNDIVVVLADGAGVFVRANANTNGLFFQSNGATFSSYGNNAIVGSSGTIDPIDLH